MYFVELWLFMFIFSGNLLTNGLKLMGPLMRSFAGYGNSTCSMGNYLTYDLNLMLLTALRSSCNFWLDLYGMTFYREDGNPLARCYFVLRVEYNLNTFYFSL